MATQALPKGSFPTMITPFIEEGEHAGEIDYPIVKRLVNWYIASGCAGIFSPCLSSEMYDLKPEERLELSRFIKETIDGRCALVSTGTFGGDLSIEEMAEFTKKIAQNCDAAVVITCHLDPDNEGDEVWKSNCQKFLDLTPGLSLGLYECPVPYKRVLSPELLAWAAGTGRFLFHKDTCCDEDQMAAKLKAVQDVGEAAASFRFYNANVETIAFSTANGGAGFSGISANFYPQLHSWLVKTMQDEEFAQDPILQKQVEDVQDFFSLAELTVCVNYPASAKEYLRTCYPDFPISSYCRKFARDGGEQPVFTRQDTIRLHAMHRLQRMISQRMEVIDEKP
eukprot:CAMPEP_0195523596 /NCGR_PEP_ID=MMETSP0794_2-20130614/22855_1 /TAXON_ID=515487 /ORGANISM="Stephanopyxis turris, Strain CCMP 815" /LENGTH=337 /DNA_ID=CAMNT_0040653621 /DNA_START=59 /DNA_END=1072 /DNA_ORIENTATION=-